MAAADYRLCDVCGNKTFYDADLNYGRKSEGDEGGPVRNGGYFFADTVLYGLGDWTVICQKCAVTHECVVREKTP